DGLGAQDGSRQEQEGSQGKAVVPVFHVECRVWLEQDFSGQRYEERPDTIAFSGILLLSLPANPEIPQ
ncbi:hypothetical protein RZS08_58205, partial [Arthrospira platensis SPKY1]|nr:hypothetical protein [Arthrospira platensis SPKY1]